MREIKIYEIVDMTAKPGTYKARNLSINAAVTTSAQRRNRPIRKEFVMRKRIAAKKVNGMLLHETKEKTIGMSLLIRR